jgi:hypothetical protein
MFYCGNCGARVAAGAKSCPSCHAVFDDQVGQGSSVQRVQRQKRFRETQAAERARTRRQQREQARDQRICGSERKWQRAAKHNAGALGAL